MSLFYNICNSIFNSLKGIDKLVDFFISHLFLGFELLLGGIPQLFF